MYKPSFCNRVLKPTIGPKIARAINPVKRLSLIFFFKEYEFIMIIYTFSMSGLPKNPVGKKISVTIKTEKAATSLYSDEIYPDHITSINPMINPPNIAPGNEPIPPSTAAVKALIPARKPI